MALEYVEYGYNEPGYVEGDSGLLPGKYNLRFFLETDGAAETAISSFVEADDRNVAIVIGIDGNPMRVVANGFDRIVASAITDDLQAQLDEMSDAIYEISDKVNTLYDGSLTIGELASRVDVLASAVNAVGNKTVSIVSDAGDIVATTEGTIGEDGSLTINVPDEVVGTSYSVLIQDQGDQNDSTN